MVCYLKNQPKHYLCKYFPISHLINMRNILIITIVFLSSLSSTFAQSTESEISKEFYKADTYISIILNYIPSDWKFIATENQFTIISPDTVWVLTENRFNTIPEKKEDQIDRIKKNGTLVIPTIVIQYENKWTPERLQQARINNAAYYDEIRKLPTKYKITHLIDKKLSSKSSTVYIPTNDQEKILLEQYEQEKSRLMEKIIRLPDFHSEKYSLFIESTSGADDDMHLVYPNAPSLELFTILSIFREVCGK